MIVYRKSKPSDFDREAQLIQSVVNLLDNKDFANFIAWFNDSLTDYRNQNDELVNADGKPLLSRNQGKCIVLKEILEFIYNSKKTLEKFK